MNTFDRILLTTIAVSMLACAVSMVWSVAATEPPPTVTNEVHVDAPAPFDRTERGEFDTDTGQFIRYPDDVPLAEDFLRDCQSVCTRPDTSLHLSGDASTDPARVLYADPPHMICACFRPNNGILGQVERYVGWRLQGR